MLGMQECSALIPLSNQCSSSQILPGNLGRATPPSTHSAITQEVWPTHLFDFRPISLAVLFSIRESSRIPAVHFLILRREQPMINELGPQPYAASSHYCNDESKNCPTLALLSVSYLPIPPLTTLHLADDGPLVCSSPSRIALCGV